MKKILMLLVVNAAFLMSVSAQQDTMQATTETQTKAVVKPKFIKATFKSTRIIDMQSVEIVSKGTMQFMISHHFGCFDQTYRCSSATLCEPTFGMAFF